jgi:hypothetical protein
VPPGWGELLGSLGDLAGAAVAVAMGIAIIVALIRGDLVPGYVYRAEVKQRADMEQRLDDARAKDEAAEASARIAEQAARTVVDLQRPRRRPRARTDDAR